MKQFRHREQTAQQLSLFSEPFVSLQVVGAHWYKTWVSCPSGRHSHMHILNQFPKWTGHESYCASLYSPKSLFEKNCSEFSMQEPIAI